MQVVNLKVSQATALEEFDARAAAGMEESFKLKESVTSPSNDGTNACAFLSVGVAESILYDTETEAFFENLPKAVEVTILSLPEEISEHRDMGKTYDILEAMKFFVDNRLLNIQKNSLKNSPLQTEYLSMKEEKSFSLNYVLLVPSTLLQFTLVIHLC